MANRGEVGGKGLRKGREGWWWWVVGWLGGGSGGGSGGGGGGGGGGVVVVEGVRRVQARVRHGCCRGHTCQDTLVLLSASSEAMRGDLSIDCESMPNAPGAVSTISYSSDIDRLPSQSASNL